MATFETRKGRTRAVIRRTDLRASRTFATMADAKLWANARLIQARNDIEAAGDGELEGGLGVEGSAAGEEVEAAQSSEVLAQPVE
jgi:hypothetical protein